MNETGAQRKNKISLADYNFRRDIENRLLMAQFSTLDLEVLEEILFSSITIPIRKLAKNVDIEESELLPILEKLKKSGLFTIENEVITVDKETRKYFEAQIVKFDEDLKPGMDFLQGLLKKVPIHVLPIWYSIPRTSNNIFDSLIEKYLLTPQIFQRYLADLNLGDPNLSGIINDVYNSPQFKVSSKDLVEKYSLSREQFEEYMLHLEFNFVCCLGYTKVGDLWKEVVRPFHEWREYLTFLRDTQAKPINDADKIVRKRSHDFAFIQDMAALLQTSKKQPIPVQSIHEGVFVPQKSALASILAKCEEMKESDIPMLISKLRILKLADVVDGRLCALGAANDWLDMRQENRAMYLYRHPLNRLIADGVSPHLCTEKTIREAERSITRVLHSGWVYYEDFLKGVIIPLNEEASVVLKRVGKVWKYALPEYTEEEKGLVSAVVMQWLYEFGVVAPGTHEGKECFCVTSFGQSLFGR